jgi:putative ABC transport system permease protein
MLFNYIKIALRNLLKYKSFSIINIMGLAVGVAGCILIMLFVLSELSYDRYHKKADRIYRVGLDAIVGSNEVAGAVTPPVMAETLVRDFPEVIAATRIYQIGMGSDRTVRYNEKTFKEERWCAVDSNFFEVFTFTFVHGNPGEALNKPNTVVITRSMANKYFGNEDPLEKFISADNDNYLVTGVIEDMPQNSHFHFDFLSSFCTYEASRRTEWLNNNLFTYFLVEKGISRENLAEKVNGMVKTYVGPELETALGIPFEKAFGDNGYYKFFIQPLLEIHLFSDYDYELEPGGNITYVYLFSIIAFGILILACINFMNLSTARSVNRSKEVGIRKTLGSSFQQLVKQFISETILLSLLAVIIALILVMLLLPYFNILSDKNLTIDLLGQAWIIPVLILLPVIVGTIAGIYPAFVLSSFNPVSVLKANNYISPKGGKILRSGLVVFQFSVSIVLIVGTMVVYNQLEYIQNKNLGFNKEQILVLSIPREFGTMTNSFKEELLGSASIIKASKSSNVFGEGFSATAYRREGSLGNENHILWRLRTDTDFADTYILTMAAGRYFSREFRSDSSAVVLNEAAAKTLGFEGDAVGKRILRIGSDADNPVYHDVIGVVKDFHFQSLHTEIRPLLFEMYGENATGRYLSVKLASGNISRSLADTEKIWKGFMPNQEFEYEFFDKRFGKLYDAEVRTGKIFTTFTVLAIFIACLGLFGLAAFTAEQKTKEIGIRKTLGATVPGIIFLLSIQFLKWILIAAFIAVPIAYYLMYSWLQNFMYRVDISFSTFIFAGVLIVIIAFITISRQAIKAATANPADSLHYE